jgi:hypothetical protein
MIDLSKADSTAYLEAGVHSEQDSPWIPTTAARYYRESDMGNEVRTGGYLGARIFA